MADAAEGVHDRLARLLFGKPVADLTTQQRAALTMFYPPPVSTNDDGDLHTPSAGWTARAEPGGLYTLWDGDMPVCRFEAGRALALAVITLRIHADRVSRIAL